MRRRLPSLDGGTKPECVARGDDTFGTAPIWIWRSRVGETDAPSTVFSLILGRIGVENGVSVPSVPGTAAAGTCVGPI